MSATKRVDVYLGDVVRLRKQHPCGGSDWTVVRLGADIGLKCLTCQHRVLLPRTQFERRLKSFVSRSAAASQSSSDAPAALGSASPPAFRLLPEEVELDPRQSSQAEPNSPKEPSSG
jgi:hypothetical protein